MKYIKKFESHNFDDYKGKLFINIPSSKYFISDIKFQIIFVDIVKIAKNIDYGDDIHMSVKGQDMIQFNQYVSGEENLIYNNTWKHYYNENEFDKIKFMTVKEFYNEYKPTYIRILNDILDRLEMPIYMNDKKLIRMLERLTIPEVEHIIYGKKFNI
jgi:hypothetical protein